MYGNIQQEAVFSIRFSPTTTIVTDFFMEARELLYFQHFQTTAFLLLHYSARKIATATVFK